MICSLFFYLDQFQEQSPVIGMELWVKNMREMKRTMALPFRIALVPSEISLFSLLYCLIQEQAV